MTDLEFVNNDEAFRYEAWLGTDLVGQIDYRLDGNIMTVTHTTTLPQFQGQGYAGALTQFMMDDLQTQRYLIKPLCPYTASWLDKHSEYNFLRA